LPKSLKKLKRKEKKMINKMGRAKSFDKFNVSEGSLSFLSKKEGTEIVNPFYDTTGRMSVNAKAHYGKDYVNSDLGKVVQQFVSFNTASRELMKIFLEWKEAGPDEKTLDDYLKENPKAKRLAKQIKDDLSAIEKYM
jgi:hypothetical protein